MSLPWRFAYHVSHSLPPLAWIASAADGHVTVRCGSSVRREQSGFVEGTWVGPPRIGSLPGSTAVFGSGIVADHDGLLVVPPSHPCERLYVVLADGSGASTLISNSLTALLVAADLSLRADVAYPPIFARAADGVDPPMWPVPTSGPPVVTAAYHNFRIAPGGSLTVEQRPREEPFTSYADYRDRLTGAVASALANAAGYQMAVSISSGYDSTAVAAVAAQLGCRQAVTFKHGKPVPGSTSLDDSGEAAARRLGMAVQSFDRLDYLRRDDLPEAEFLATGMSGEDVVMSTMERQLQRALVLTGSEALPIKGYPPRPGLGRADLSACSLTEFRLRADFVHLPALFFGASEKRSLMAIVESPEMRPWRVPGRYDKPIQRRLAEEAGVPRGTFAIVKRRASARIHVEGLAAMAPASAAAVARFALAQGSAVPAGTRPLIGRADRLAIRLARALRVGRLSAPLERRRRALVHAEPALGSLLFRWAVSVVSQRYSELAGFAAPGAATAPPSRSR